MKLVIHNCLKNISDIIKKSEDYLHICNSEISELYYEASVGKPYFDEIIVNDDNLNVNQMYMLYNMLLLESKLIFISKYNNIFTDHIINTNNIFSEVTKKDNKLYKTIKRPIIDFIIIGAQKSGTTSIYNNLIDHPKISLQSELNPELSEIHFFDKNWKKGINWYKSKLNYDKEIVGEKTPSLLYLSHTFPLIQQVNPHVKLIVILRNPIDRAFSNYKMHQYKYKYKLNNQTFDDVINKELRFRLNENKTFRSMGSHYLQRGLYYDQIIELKKWFPDQNILILLTEDMAKKPLNVFNNICKFLNVDEMNDDKKLDKYNVNRSKKNISPKTYKKLVEFYKDDVKKLEKLLNRKLNWF